MPVGTLRTEDTRHCCSQHYLAIIGGAQLTNVSLTTKTHIKPEGWLGTKIMPDMPTGDAREKCPSPRLSAACSPGVPTCMPWIHCEPPYQSQSIPVGAGIQQVSLLWNMGAASAASLCCHTWVVRAWGKGLSPVASSDQRSSNLHFS